MTTLANQLHGIPSVASTTERAALIPSPAVGQKIFRRDSNGVEEWQGASWVQIFTADSGTRTASVNVTYAGVGAVFDNTAAAALGNKSITFKRGGTAIYHLGFTASDTGAILNAAGNTANLSWTDAGAFTFRAGITATILTVSSSSAQVLTWQRTEGSAKAWQLNTDNAGFTFRNNTDGIDVITVSNAGNLTLAQGGDDGEIFTLRSSDVAHGMTALTDATSYGIAKKISASAGGTAIIGYSSGTGGLFLGGRHTTDATVKSTAANAAVFVQGELRSGTGVTSLGADANIFAVGNGAATRFILDSDGDSHQDVGTAWTNFDTHDDVALLNLLSAHVTRRSDPLRASFRGWLEQNRAELERVKLVTFNDDGHHFVNMSRLVMLLVGAVRQVGDRMDRIEERLIAA